MNRTPFSIVRKIQLMIDWYGESYSFKRDVVNSYNEPSGTTNDVQTLFGIYHASERSFVELINVEGASIKSKVSKGILCANDETISVQQNDKVSVNEIDFFVTAVEPVLYGKEAIAYEISLEEVVKGNEAE